MLYSACGENLTWMRSLGQEQMAAGDWNQPRVDISPCLETLDSSWLPAGHAAGFTSGVLAIGRCHQLRLRRPLNRSPTKHSKAMPRPTIMLMTAFP